MSVYCYITRAESDKIRAIPFTKKKPKTNKHTNKNQTKKETPEQKQNKTIKDTLLPLQANRQTNQMKTIYV